MTLALSSQRSFTPLFSIAQIREIEKNTSLTPWELMHRAAQASCIWLTQHLPTHASVLFLAGPGNNGGDALLSAYLLQQTLPSISITLWLTVPPDHLQALAAQAYQLAQQVVSETFQIVLIGNTTRLPIYIDPPDWIIDGLFGIGLTRPLDNFYSHLLHHIGNQTHTTTQILALDVPSGLNADHGYISASLRADIASLQDHPNTDEFCVLAADYTLTFIGHKPGLYMHSGRDVAGEIVLANLDLPAHLLPEPIAILNHPALFNTVLPRRHHHSHKGSYGTVHIVGGSEGMLGAPLLAGRTALLSGAGKVLIGLLHSTPPVIDWAYPELMLMRFSALAHNENAVWLLGPGMAHISEEIIFTISSAKSCILDAGALNQLALSTAMQKAVTARHAQGKSTILTPHPLEAARLLKCSVDDIQHARLQSVATLAKQFGAIIVLKGSGTVIDEEGQRPVINPTGCGALATAGSGDVLAGLIAALIAQGMSGYKACCAAVWLHGAAADDLVSEGIGPVGLNANALPTAIRHQINTCNTTPCASTSSLQ
ncbi:MAG: NAD(P)H-hydrate dehydratase [Ottowia sp.]|nr:NAD(P)H-hydrate dehydratase [Ottowia sp.]